MSERDDAVERLKSFIKDDAGLDFEMIPHLLEAVDLLAESEYPTLQHEVEHLRAAMLPGGQMFEALITVMRERDDVRVDNQALRDEAEMLRDRNASKRSENVLYVEQLDKTRAELWETTTAAAETLGALQASYDTVCEEQAETLRELATLIGIARAPFMTPDKERSDGRTDVWEFDGVCCPVCDVMSSDVLDHLLVEDDFEHNRWLGIRLEALRTFLAASEPKEDDEAWGAVANRGDRHAELTRKSPRSPRTSEVDGGDELATRHDLTCSYDDCIAPPGSKDHQMRPEVVDYAKVPGRLGVVGPAVIDRPIDKLPKDPE